MLWKVSGPKKEYLIVAANLYGEVEVYESLVEDV